MQHPHRFAPEAPELEAGALGFVVTTLLPVWLFGLVTGLMFPRQPVLSDLRAWLCSAAASAVSLGARSTLLSQAMMFINGALFVQSLWYRFTEPGTFTALVARAAAALGLPAPASSGKGDSDAREAPAVAADDEASAWYITRKDLDFFLQRTSDRSDAAVGPWETIVEKDIPGVVKYHSKRRTCKDIRKTEYLSTSLTADTSPHEVMDFYLSDPARQGWDNLLTHTEVVVNGDFEHREQVVHWVRSFPFAFLSDRSYIIGRRMFEQDGKLYGISKVIKFPGHDSGRTVRMDNYWSMWSCEPAPCPFGTDKPATKTVLLHMEDFKISENLSRFAVKCGMWGYIKQMSPHLRRFADERRARGIDLNERDPHAFGSPQVSAEHARRPLEHSASEAQVGAATKKLRKVASAVVAGSMLLALGNATAAKGSDGNLRRRKRFSSQRLGSDDEGSP